MGEVPSQVGGVVSARHQLGGELVHREWFLRAAEGPEITGLWEPHPGP